MDHWIIYGLMAIAAATYCVVFGFGPVFVAWACIRRIAAGRRPKTVEAVQSLSCAIYAAFRPFFLPEPL